MPTTPKQTTAPPKKRAAPRKSRAEAVATILQNVEDKLAKGSMKATLGDYIKLIQLSKEMSEEAKTEIKVTWIEEPKSPPEE